jgi:antitoxin Phd
LDFEKFNKEASPEEEKLDIIANRILKENIVAFKALAK